MWDNWDDCLTYDELLLLQLEAIQQEKEKLSKRMEKSRKIIERIERSNKLYHMEVDWLECAKDHYFAALEKKDLYELNSCDTVMS